MKTQTKQELMASKTAYRVLREVIQGENRNPSSIAESTDIGKGNISSALSALKKHDICRREKDGRKRLYYLKTDDFFQDWRKNVLAKADIRIPNSKPEETVRNYFDEFKRNPRTKDVFEWHIKHYTKAVEESSIERMLYDDFLYTLKSDVPTTEDHELNSAVHSIEETLSYATSFQPNLEYGKSIRELARTN